MKIHRINPCKDGQMLQFSMALAHFEVADSDTTADIKDKLNRYLTKQKQL